MTVHVIDAKGGGFRHRAIFGHMKARAPLNAIYRGIFRRMFLTNLTTTTARPVKDFAEHFTHTGAERGGTDPAQLLTSSDLSAFVFESRRTG